jgi:hypothetical protein
MSALGQKQTLAHVRIMAGGHFKQSLTRNRRIDQGVSPLDAVQLVREENYDNPQNSHDCGRATCGWGLAGNGTGQSAHIGWLPTCGPRRVGHASCTRTGCSGTDALSSHNPAPEKVAHASAARHSGLQCGSAGQCDMRLRDRS